MQSNFLFSEKCFGFRNFPELRFAKLLRIRLAFLVGHLPIRRAVVVLSYWRNLHEPPQETTAGGEVGLVDL